MTTDQLFDLPVDRHYERDSHLWIRRDTRTGRVRIGIDALGLQSLGKLAYVSLQAVGITLTQGESVGSFEAAKMTSDIVTPISGTVVARNEDVLRDPLLVNQAPHDGGWLFELEPTRWAEESEFLVSGAAIAPWAAAEAARIGGQDG